MKKFEELEKLEEFKELDELENEIRSIDKEICLKKSEISELNKQLKGQQISNIVFKCIISIGLIIGSIFVIDEIIKLMTNNSSIPLLTRITYILSIILIILIALIKSNTFSKLDDFIINKNNYLNTISEIDKKQNDINNLQNQKNEKFDILNNTFDIYKEKI